MPSSNERRNLGRNVDQTSAGAQDVIGKASDVARPMVHRIVSGAHGAVDKAAGAASQVAETLGVKAEQLKNAQMRALEQCGRYVRDNPATSLGIAIAAGFLLSRLLSVH